MIGGGSGFITRRGRVVYTWGDTTLRYDLKSATKSIGSIALGLALDDGRLRLTDLAQTHLPSLGVPPKRNSTTGWLDEITILQLATHTAGFEKPGGYVALDFQPGTTWFYSDGGVNWLADVLTQVYGEDLNTLLFSRVWSTIGITDASVMPTGSLSWRANAQRDHKLNGVKRRELASGIRPASTPWRELAICSCVAAPGMGSVCCRNPLWIRFARLARRLPTRRMPMPRNSLPRMRTRRAVANQYLG